MGQTASINRRRKEAEGHSKHYAQFQVYLRYELMIMFGHFRLMASEEGLTKFNFDSFPWPRNDEKNSLENCLSSLFGLKLPPTIRESIFAAFCSAFMRDFDKADSFKSLDEFSHITALTFADFIRVLSMCVRGNLTHRSRFVFDLYFFGKEVIKRRKSMREERGRNSRSVESLSSLEGSAEGEGEEDKTEDGNENRDECEGQDEKKEDEKEEETKVNGPKEDEDGKEQQEAEEDKVTPFGPPSITKYDILAFLKRSPFLEVKQPSIMVDWAMPVVDDQKAMEFLTFFFGEEERLTEEEFIARIDCLTELVYTYGFSVPVATQSFKKKKYYSPQTHEDYELAMGAWVIIGGGCGVFGCLAAAVEEPLIQAKWNYLSLNGWTFTGEIDNFGGEEKEGWERNQMVWEKSGRKGGGVFDSLFLVNGILRRIVIWRGYFYLFEVKQGGIGECLEVRRLVTGFGVLNFESNQKWTAALIFLEKKYEIQLPVDQEQPKKLPVSTPIELTHSSLFKSFGKEEEAPPLTAEIQEIMNKLGYVGDGEDPAQIIQVLRLQFKKRTVGVSCKTRRFLFTTYPDCFIGKEAVSWIQNRLGCPREGAVKIGEYWQTMGDFEHVTRAHTFKDAFLFYHFVSYSPNQKASSSPPTTTSSPSPLLSASPPSSPSSPLRTTLAPKPGSLARTPSLYFEEDSSTPSSPSPPIRSASLGQGDKVVEEKTIKRLTDTDAEFELDDHGGKKGGGGAGRLSYSPFQPFPSLGGKGVERGKLSQRKLISPSTSPTPSSAPTAQNPLKSSMFFSPSSYSCQQTRRRELQQKTQQKQFERKDKKDDEKEYQEEKQDEEKGEQEQEQEREQEREQEQKRKMEEKEETEKVKKEEKNVKESNQSNQQNPLTEQQEALQAYKEEKKEEEQEETTAKTEEEEAARIMERGTLSLLLSSSIPDLKSQLGSSNSNPSFGSFGSFGSLPPSTPPATPNSIRTSTPPPPPLRQNTPSTITSTPLTTNEENENEEGEEGKRLRMSSFSILGSDGSGSGGVGEKEEEEREINHSFFAKLKKKSCPRPMNLLIQMFALNTPPRIAPFGMDALPVNPYIDIEFLVDGEQYFPRVAEALLQAKEEIFIGGWCLNPQIYLTRGEHQWSDIIHENLRLDTILSRVANRGVQIYIMIWNETKVALEETIGSYGTMNHLLSLHPTNIHIIRHPRAFPVIWSHHQKIVCVDQRLAFVGGLDLCFGRYDTKAHKVTDDSHVNPQFPGKDFYNPRLKGVSDLQHPFNDLLDRHRHPRMPWHDVSVSLNREAAADVAWTFIQRWNEARKDPMDPIRGGHPILFPKFHDEPETLSPPHQRRGTCSVQILRSLSPWSAGVATENTIYTAILSSIKNSKHFLYIENQYFISDVSCFGGGGGGGGGEEEEEGGEAVGGGGGGPASVVENRVLEAIVKRIVQAIKKKEVYRVYIVVPMHPEGDPNEKPLRLIQHYQFKTLCRGENSLISMVEKACLASGDPNIKADDYVQLLSLRNWGLLANGAVLVDQIYVHSKMMIIDDTIAIVGSANINDRSLLGDRDSEIAAYIKDDHMVQSVMNSNFYLAGRKIRDLRMQLWQEHLGVHPQDHLLTHILTDPISSETWEYFHHVVKTNAKCYEQFPLEDIVGRGKGEGGEGEGGVGEGAYPKGDGKWGPDVGKYEKLVGVVGHLVEYPRDFLAGEDLERTSLAVITECFV